MKDRLRKSRYKPNAEMPINVWHLGKRSMKTLKKFLKSVSLPMLGESLFKNKKGDE